MRASHRRNRGSRAVLVAPPSDELAQEHISYESLKKVLNVDDPTVPPATTPFAADVVESMWGELQLPGMETKRVGEIFLEGGGGEREILHVGCDVKLILRLLQARDNKLQEILKGSLSVTSPRVPLSQYGPPLSALSIIHAAEDKEDFQDALDMPLATSENSTRALLPVSPLATWNLSYPQVRAPTTLIYRESMC